MGGANMEYLKLIQSFHFIRAEWLWLLIPFSLLIYFNWKESEKKQQWLVKLPEHLRNALKVGDNSWIKALPLKLLYVACLLAIVVAAGPTWHKQASPFGEDQSQMIVVLDLSESMLAEDLMPSRLQRAKQKINQLIELRDQGSVSLIVYAGSAHIAMPLTRDKQVFKPLLDALNPEVMPREGKYAQYSLSLIEKMTSKQSITSTVVLFADAVNETAIKDFSSFFKTRSDQLLVIGMGDEQYAQQASYPYQPDTLKLLAKQANGDFIQASVDDKDIKRVNRKAQQQLIMSPESTMPWKDLGYPVIFVLAVFYALWFRKGWVVKWSVLLVVSSITLQPNTVQAQEFNFADIWLTKDQQGQLLFNKQEYLQAAGTFQSNSWKAYSYYLAGEYQLAQNYFLREDTLENKFAAGAALANQREYVAARAIYQSIYEQDPSYPGAKENMQLMQKIIDDIDMFTDSQSGNTERQSSRELGNKPQTSDGKEVEVEKEQLIEEKLTFDDLINDQQANEKWMRRVEGSLQQFLSAKFYYQLQEGKATQEYLADE